VGLIASPVERGYVLLQAAVAEGALGDIPAAYSRIGELLDLDDDALLTLARVAADFVGKVSPWSSTEWTRVLTDAGDQVNLDQVTEARRVSSLRLLSAYGAGDEAMFEALFRAACADPDRRRLFQPSPSVPVPAARAMVGCIPVGTPAQEAAAIQVILNAAGEARRFPRFAQFSRARGYGKGAWT